MKKKVIIAAIITLLGFSLWADNLNGPVDSIITLSSVSPETQDLKIKVEDLVPIFIEGSASDIMYMDIEIRSNEILKKYSGSFSLFIYKNIRENIKRGINSCSGDFAAYKILPDRTRYFIRIPFGDSSRSSVSDFVNIALKDGDFPIMLTILPLSKGIPEEAFYQFFELKIVSKWYDTGKVKINIKNPEIVPEKAEIYIDNRKIENINNIVLPAGEHTAGIKYEGYNDSIEDIEVKSGETSEISFFLKKAEPFAEITAPSGVRMFFDGEEYKNPFCGTIPTGEHSVVFIIGEESLSRKFSAENGKKYLISLSLDIEITEK